MDYQFEAIETENNEKVYGDLVHVGNDTFIVEDAEIESMGNDGTDLFATVFWKVFPESVKLVKGEE